LSCPTVERIHPAALAEAESQIQNLMKEIKAMGNPATSAVVVQFEIA